MDLKRIAATMALAGATLVCTPAWGQACSAEQTQFVLPDDKDDDQAYFGSSVDSDGDVLIIGAPLDSELVTESGAAYIFRRVDNLWTQEQKLKSSDFETGQRFGCDVGVSGNIAIVGASMADLPTKADAGAVYVFDYDPNRSEGLRWSQVAVLTPDDLLAGDSFVSVRPRPLAIGAARAA